MTNTLKPLNLGRRILTEEEVLEQLAGYQPTNPRQELEPTPQPQPTPEPEQEADIIPQDYILLEGTNNYQDTFISTTRTHQGNNWNKTQELLHARDLYMPTIKQFVDFLKLLRSGTAFNGNGDNIPSSQLDAIYKDITEVKDPWRAEWLDAKFEGNLIHYHHRTRQGSLQSVVSEGLVPYLRQDKTPGIDLEYWINNSTSQGLPLDNTLNGNLYYWHPRDGAVARFSANSDRAYLICSRYPWSSNSSLGVRPCARKN
ncbi:MAG: hypothetical protein ABIJ18_03240 [archaeon]